MNTFEQPDLPQPRDVLNEHGYDPLEHLLELNRPNKALAPHEPDIIVRWFPYDAQSVDSIRQYGPITTSTLESLMTDQEEEYARLAAHGIVVARHRSDVLPDNPALGAAVPSIATVVERINGAPLRGDDPRGHHLPARYARHAANSTGANHVLTDIQHPGQHLIASGDDAIPILHDIEPRLVRGEQARNLIYDRQFAGWAEQVRTPEARAALAHELGRLGMPFFAV